MTAEQIIFLIVAALTLISAVFVVTSRNLVHAALWQDDPRLAAAILAAGVQQRLTTADRLRDLLLPERWHPRQALYLSVLEDVEGGSQALSEIDFIGVCRRNNLPEPVRQARRADSAGRVRYLDAYWADEELAVEVDGAPHLSVLNAWSDMQRQNEIVLDGQRVLRFPSIALRVDEDKVVAQLRRGLLTPIRHLRRSA